MCSEPNEYVRYRHGQKIDKLKSQLTQLANLLSEPSTDDAGADELDDQELEVLREAGVLPPAPGGRRARRKTHSKKGKHIVFAADPDEGTSTFVPRLARWAVLSLRTNIEPVGR